MYVISNIKNRLEIYDFKATFICLALKKVFSFLLPFFETFECVSGKINATINTAQCCKAWLKLAYMEHMKVNGFSTLTRGNTILFYHLFTSYLECSLCKRIETNYREQSNCPFIYPYYK